MIAKPSETSFYDKLLLMSCSNVYDVRSPASSLPFNIFFHLAIASAEKRNETWKNCLTSKIDSISCNRCWRWLIFAVVPTLPFKLSWSWLLGLARWIMPLHFHHFAGLNWFWIFQKKKWKYEEQK